MIGIRVLTEDDWRLWKELRLAALADAPAAFGSRLADWQDAGEERWRSRLAMPGSRNLVADVGGSPAGMASGVPAGDPAARELIAMWVRPDARGRRVGDALIAAVADWARTEGAAELRLAVYPHNTAAVNLYRRNGFAEVAPQEGAERFMAKPLGDPA
jgi:ribosomal protein S18 acetylase RimI-like enzyme